MARRVRADPAKATNTVALIGYRNGERICLRESDEAWPIEN